MTQTAVLLEALIVVSKIMPLRRLSLISNHTPMNLPRTVQVACGRKRNGKENAATETMCSHKRIENETYFFLPL